MDCPRSANKFMMWFLIYSIIISIAAAPIVLIVSLSCASVGWDESDIMNAVLIGQDFLLFLIPMAVYLLFSGQSIKKVIPFKKLSLKNAIYVILITLLVMPMMSVLATVTNIVVQSDTSEMFTEIMEKMPGWVSVISMAIMPPIFEESMFRGFILTGYKKYGFVKAALISALFFGMMHLDLYQLPYATMVGVIFAGFVYCTGSIYASMLAHFVINGSQTAMFLLFKHFGDTSMLEEQATVTMEQQLLSVYVWLGIMIFCLPFLIFLVNRFVKRNKANYEAYIAEDKVENSVEELDAVDGMEQKENKGRWLDKCFVITMIIYLVYMALFGR